MKRKSLLSFGRVTATTAAAVALTVMAVGPAAANPSTATRQGSQVRWTAFSGEMNNLLVDDFLGLVRVSDPGIIAGPGCTTLAPQASVTCGTIASTSRLSLTGGNLNDTIDIQDSLTIPADIVGGPGADDIDAANGSDRITDSDGWPALPGSPNVSAEGGDDTVMVRNGGFDRVICGSGFDTVIADPVSRDVVDPVSCERVIRY
ncbi:hypothetical protein NLX86_10115 [Streptomyces sp. A3M-1-3]|uniref:hypothetical protein n=1 Tax=Streptomyces sp. A3M-1-3 TaxID=2962044 RepID=UPI0020B64E8D|nr:hypothetical protein [Streptomyces sp. A3M-1-3]MCP3818456.1 hypothetical protein [Streptomyces sp. A3M-1-3]